MLSRKCKNTANGKYTLRGEGKILRKASALLFALLLASMTGLLFCFQTAKAITTIYIQTDGTVYPISAPIQRNGNIYTFTSNINSDTDGIVIEKNSTILDGAEHSLQGTNTASSNGIYLSGNYNVTIKNIDIKGFESGILLDAYSTYNNIIGNTVESNVYGVNCWAYADNNSIIGNNITGNSLSGIWIAGSSSDTVSENIIAENSLGINLQSSSNDSIYHNNFVDNPTQTSIYDSPGVWDNGYPSGGNYWSDYSGVDLQNGPNQNQPGSDGIGDTPYNTSESNQDNYPLMQVFTNIHVQPTLPPKTIEGQGYTFNIQLQLENQGWEAETTSVTVYVNTTLLSAFTNLAMSSTEQILLNSTWQTGTYAKGDYTISIVASPVPGEVDTTDDSYIWTVHLGIPGDVSGNTLGVYDKVVNMKDIAYLVVQFNTKPTSANWNPNADINGDAVVNMRDIAIAIANFNKRE